jgi:hypothetical protein
MPPPDVITDNGYISGCFDVPIGSAVYTFNTADHDKPVAESVAMNAAGLFNGGASVKQQEKISGTIFAQGNQPEPPALTPFQFAFDGTHTKWWKLTNLKAARSNSGAALKLFTVDITEMKNSPVPGLPVQS